MSSVVPEGWFSKSLDEVSIFIRDGTHGTHERLNEGIPLLSAKNISSDGHINCDSGDSLISEIDYQKIHAKYVIEKDDLLLTVVGTLGRTALVPKGFRKFTLQRSVAIIRLDAKTIHPELCYQYLSGDEFQRQLSLRSNSTAQAGVYLGELARISIPVPPLPEQKKIASILTSVDEVIENAQKQIDKLQDLKKATMNELLTKGIGHTEFKDSELGQSEASIKYPFGGLPDLWEYRAIDSLVDFLTGPAFDSAKFNTNKMGARLVRGINLTRGATRWSDASTKYWEHDLGDFKKYQLRHGDTVIGMDGSLVGKNYAFIGSSDLPALLVQRVARLRATEKIDATYLYYLFGTGQWISYVELVKTNSGIPHISNGDIKSFRIPVPPLPEQKKIASILTSMDKAIKEKKTKLSQTQSLKKSLMQDLLTGKVRVTVN
jgi:type I restriction enzyme S subunit